MVQVLVLLALALLVSALARRRGWSAPLLLVLVGVVVSFVPGIPVYELDPDLVLLVFLPPLLYWAAWESSYLNLRQNLRAIGLLSVGLVLFTAFAVGYVMHSLVPGLGLAAALALGAIVAPPDAVAATAIGREMGLPRRLITILAGESLINDATALTAYRVAVSAAMGGGSRSWAASRSSVSPLWAEQRSASLVRSSSSDWCGGSVTRWSRTAYPS